MKIAIFGDSFASVPKPRFTCNPTLSWPEILMKKFNVDCFGVPSTSLLFSTKRFKILHSKYDKIIFVVTHPGRLDFNSHTYSFAKTPTDFLCLNMAINFNGAEKALSIANENKEVNDTIKEALQVARAHFIYIHDNRTASYFQEFIIQDIKNIRPDVILIPAFPNSLNSQEIMSMYNIQRLEDDHWGRNIEGRIGVDFRYCHMSGENNEIFAEHVTRWIKGDPVIIQLEKFVRPTSPMTYYFSN